MASRVVAPVPVRLSLSDGDWIEIKAQLNHGEYHGMLEQMYRLNDAGEVIRLPMKWGDALVAAYLLDWSLVDLQDQPLAIRGRRPVEIMDALNSINQESFTEIKEAIEAHVERATAERAEKKRRRSGANASALTSPSLVGVTGGMNG